MVNLGLLENVGRPIHCRRSIACFKDMARVVCGELSHSLLETVTHTSTRRHAPHMHTYK